MLRNRLKLLYFFINERIVLILQLYTQINVLELRVTLKLSRNFVNSLSSIMYDKKCISYIYKNGGGTIFERIKHRFNLGYYIVCVEYELDKMLTQLLSYVAACYHEYY